jgi:hypothetical protein
VDEEKFCVDEQLCVHAMYACALGTELVSNVCRKRSSRQRSSRKPPHKKARTRVDGATPSAADVLLDRIAVQTDQLGADIQVIAEKETLRGSLRC